MTTSIPRTDGTTLNFRKALILKLLRKGPNLNCDQYCKVNVISNIQKRYFLTVFGKGHSKSKNKVIVKLLAGFLLLNPNNKETKNLRGTNGQNEF